MKSEGEIYTDSEVAGMKLLGAAVQRNAEKVAMRYKNDATRVLCYAMRRLGEGIMECAENQQPFTIALLIQDTLPGFWLSDDAYGKIE